MMLISLTITHILLWVAIIVEAIALCVLFHINTRLANRASSDRPRRELRLGTPFPSITFLSSHGAVQPPMKLHEKFRQIVFIAPHCGLCRRILRPVLRARNSELRRVAIYCHGTQRSCVAVLRSFGVQHDIPLLLKHRDDPVDALGLATIPAVVHLGRDGRITEYSYPLDTESMERALRTDMSVEVR